MTNWWAVYRWIFCKCEVWMSQGQFRINRRKTRLFTSLHMSLAAIDYPKTRLINICVFTLQQVLLFTWMTHFRRFFSKLSGGTHFNIWRRNNTNWWPRSWPLLPQRSKLRGVATSPSTTGDHWAWSFKSSWTRNNTIISPLASASLFNPTHLTGDTAVPSAAKLPEINEFLIWRKHHKFLK